MALTEEELMEQADAFVEQELERLGTGYCVRVDNSKANLKILVALAEEYGDKSTAKKVKKEAKTRMKKEGAYCALNLGEEYCKWFCNQIIARGGTATVAERTADYLDDFELILECQIDMLPEYKFGYYFGDEFNEPDPESIKDMTLYCGIAGIE